MNGQNQTGMGNQVTGEIIKNLLQPNVETIFVKDDMVMAQVNIQSDEYSDFLFVLMEYHLGRLYVVGVGTTFDDAIRNALWRAAQNGPEQVGDIEKIQKIKAFETAHGLGGE
jgi:hypothetical protein